jgi:hypothetical protein
MRFRIKHSLVFGLERIVMQGALARFALLLALVLLAAFGAGLLVRAVAPGFDSVGGAIWWAFLRLTDPGYLGDDEGLARALVSTTVTLLGYILFMGALIAILVQWLDSTLERLELGLTPVAMDAHVVLLGWTSRSLAILEEIFASEGRMERFLRQSGARRLRVAVLAERAGPALTAQLRAQLGGRRQARRVVLRSGSCLRLEDLQRVDFAHAAAVLLPAADIAAGSALDADARSVKTLMTIGAALAEDPPEQPPLVVMEVQDMRHAAGLRALYPGPLEILAGDDVLVRLLAQSIRQPGLSHVYQELLSDVGGPQVYVREQPQLGGIAFARLAYALPEGVLLGVVRPEGRDFAALLNPPGDLRLAPGDRLAVLASSYADAVPPEDVGAAPDLIERPAPPPRLQRRRRVLVLGWNPLVPALLSEFASYPDEHFEIDIVSELSASKRTKRVAVEEIDQRRIQVRQLELDYTVAAHLEDLEPAAYDNVLLLRSGRLKAGAESDARTILAYLLLRDLTAGARRPHVLMELTDPENTALFETRLENEHTEILVTPRIISHMLARVAMRRELRAVLDELFSSGGCEIAFRPLADYGLDAGTHAFAALQRAADARGAIAIGIRRHDRLGAADGGVELNPGRDERLELAERDELIVVSL